MKNDSKISKQVYLMGFISLFNDIASEMLYPIMPIFLTQILGAPVFVVGMIEGCAEFVASFLKTYFGKLSDKMGIRRSFVMGGYGTSVLAKIILAFSNSWLIVFLGRVTDKFGKGLRTGARDAMLLSYTDEKNKGLVFGIHRTLDSAGAVIGPLIALLLLNITNQNIRLILMASVIPGIIAVMFFLFLKEVKSAPQEKDKLNLRGVFGSLNKNLQIFLIGTALFSLGNSSDSFLILKATNLGLTTGLVILAYVVYNLSYTVFSTPAGYVADKLGSKKVFLFGIGIYALVYLLFALNSSAVLVFFLFGIYGVYIALTDGVSKAIIGEYVDKTKAGTVYGLYQTITGLMTLLASLIGGLLWTYLGSASTFYFGAGCAVLTFLLLWKNLKN